MRNQMFPGSFPIAPSLDLRSMLRAHIVRRCTAALKDGETRRQQAVADGAWDEAKEEIRAVVANAFGKMPFGRSGAALNARLVSSFEREHYRVENVLFESLPGWEVNGSVYLPREGEGPWPGVVVPVGHSGKQFESYQIPAQVFARCGYVAITFDPPGQASEKQQGNDHFRDGVRCYLTGHSSNRYFVLDALRCIDYLESREDVNTTGGVAMTGVSGGGVTSAFAALFDDRIAALGPACCMAPMVAHPVQDGYGTCPEPLFPGRIAHGIDSIDLLAAAAPVPILLMAGEEDEVFHVEETEQLARRVQEIYDATALGDRYQFLVDQSGHAYTVRMALAFAGWMNRWLLNEPDRFVPELTREDFEMEEPELLQCRPRQDVNMFSLNAELARRLRDSRRSARPVQSMSKVVPDLASVPLPRAHVSAPFQVWTHYNREVLLKISTEIELPATFLYAVDPIERGPAILFFDDAGRWSLLRGSGPLAAAIRFLEREAMPKPALLTVDLRGWGDTAPSPVPYEMAGWAAPERWLSYVSAALDDHVLAMRVRDAVAAFQFLRLRDEIDPERIIIGGRGMGAVVALHVAAFAGDPASEMAYLPAGVICMDMPASFEQLCTAEQYSWPADAFLPGVLEHYDIPEMVGWLGLMPMLLLNPRDAEGRPLSTEAAQELYNPGDMETAAEIATRLEPPQARERLAQWVCKLAGAE